MDASSQRHPFLLAATIAGKGLPPAWQVPLFPQSQPFHWVSACKFRVLEMPASAVTAFDASEFEDWRTLLWIEGNVTEPPGASGLNPAATIRVARPGRNVGAILQRHWSSARVWHGEPDDALESLSRIMHGELDLPGMLSGTSHECLAFENSMCCSRLALASGQEQQK